MHCIIIIRSSELNQLATQLGSLLHYVGARVTNLAQGSLSNFIQNWREKLDEGKERINHKCRNHIIIPVELNF